MGIRYVIIAYKWILFRIEKGNSAKISEVLELIWHYSLKCGPLLKNLFMRPSRHCIFNTFWSILFMKVLICRVSIPKVHSISEDMGNGPVTELLCGEETGPGPCYIVVAVPEGVMSYR